MRNIFILIFTLISASCAQSRPLIEKRTNFCKIVNEIDKYNNKDVRFVAYAKPALEGFKVELSDQRCESRNIFLSVKKEFAKNIYFFKIMKKLYPDYPDHEGYNDVSIKVEVSGTIYHGKDYGTSWTYVEMTSINVLEE